MALCSTSSFRPARCQRRHALFQAASEGFAIRPRVIVTDKLRSYGVVLRQLLQGVEKPITEQSCRELASTDATTRAADAMVQIVGTGAGLPLRSFLHLRALPSTSKSTCSPRPSRDPVGRFRNLAPGDTRHRQALLKLCKQELAPHVAAYALTSGDVDAGSAGESTAEAGRLSGGEILTTKLRPEATEKLTIKLVRKLLQPTGRLEPVR